MNNNEFLTHIFPTPILSAISDNAQIRKTICALSQNFRDNANNDGLVSDAWDDGELSSDKDKINKKGITSFYSGALFDKPEWREVSDFIYSFANTLISSVYSSKHDVMTLTNMWTTVYPQGAYVPQHIHDNSLLSGVFYANAPKKAGNIVFHDPSYIAKTMFSRGPKKFPALPTKHEIEVKDGLMIIFPGWLPHNTKPNESGEDRIIVSFNIGFADAPNMDTGS